MTTNPFGQNPEGSAFKLFSEDLAHQNAQAARDDIAGARFAAGAEGTSDAGTETPATPEKKAEPIDPAQVRAKLLMYTLQLDSSVAFGGFVKSQKDTEINKLVERASDELGVSQFTVQAPTVDGGLEEISKISVKRTKAKTSITSEKALLNWATNVRPDLTETRQRISPHLDPKILAEAYAFILERDPNGVEDVTELKPNALPLLLNEGKIDGEDLLVDVAEIDHETGEVGEPKSQAVPGVRHDKGGKYDGFIQTHGGTGQPNQKKAIALLMENKIEGTDLRSIMAGPQAQLEAGK